jgi:hypothetical protein
MPAEPETPSPPTPPVRYQIRLRGHLNPACSDWFEGLQISQAGGDTLLTGDLPDQAALFGLLKTVRDLGLPLLSLAALEPPCDQNEPGA